MSKIINTVVNSVRDVFVKKGEHLFWKRLPVNQIYGGYKEEPIENDQAYFVLRMKEMYLQNTRVLWRKYYPMLRGYVKYSNKEELSVTGPGQLKELGETNPDRVINLNHRLAGPIPYKGDDVTVVAGLYAVPGQDATKALVETVGQLAALGGVALGQALEVTNIVKSAVEGIVGMGETTLSLGVEDTFYQGNPFRSGLYLGVSAPSSAVKLNELWLKDGKLVQGRDPIAAKRYTDYDYMILEVERRPNREDWPGLPKIAEFNDQFSVVMRDCVTDEKGKRERLAKLWPQFTQALYDSPYLITRDREQIEVSVSRDLNKRLDSMENKNPFETRAWGSANVRTKAPEEFDFLDVPDYLDEKDRSNAGGARALAGENPFGS
jgi:hypothetical protein